MTAVFNMDQLDIYPMPNKEDVKKLFLGKYLKQLPAPCVVVDQSIVKAHCKQMLDACKARDVWLRTYIKTYKSCSCY